MRAASLYFAMIFAVVAGLIVGSRWNLILSAALLSLMFMADGICHAIREGKR